MNNNINLYLSSEGNSFIFSKKDKNSSQGELQQQAQQCKTHRAVLEFLNSIREKQGLFEFRHEHNSNYDGHNLDLGFGLYKGQSHECEYDQMVEFVKQKVTENYQKVTLYLGKDGNSIEAQFNRSRSTGVFSRAEYITDKDGLSEIHPLLGKAADCKTHYAAFQYFKELQNETELLKHISIYHDHNRHYSDHYLGFCGINIGKAHECAHDKSLEFIKQRIRIKDLESVKDIFDYLEEIQPEVEVSLLGSRRLKFKEYSISLERLMDLIREVADKTLFGKTQFLTRKDRPKEDLNNDEEYQERNQLALNLTEKVRGYFTASERKLRQRNKFTKILASLRNFNRPLQHNGDTSIESVFGIMQRRLGLQEYEQCIKVDPKKPIQQELEKLEKILKLSEKEFIISFFNV